MLTYAGISDVVLLCVFFMFCFNALLAFSLPGPHDLQGHVELRCGCNETFASIEGRTGLQHRRQSWAQRRKRGFANTQLTLGQVTHLLTFRTPSGYRKWDSRIPKAPF